MPGGDPDGDGLSNLGEFQNGADPNDADPNDADSDNDAMPDGWEVDNDLNPLTNDAALDPDGDGASNLREFAAGSDPRDANDDGIANMSLLLSLNGIDTSRRTGPWRENGTQLAALENTLMRVEYEVTITNADMLVFGVQVANVDTNTTWATSFDLQLLIDGVRVGWLSPTVAPGASAWAYSGILPYMSAGKHTLRLAWLDNYIGGELLGINTVVLEKINGADADDDGIKDWVEAILATGVDSDGDGLSDLAEIEHQPTALEPLRVDTDGDTLGDYDEMHVFGTDPTVADTDLDGLNDAFLLAERNGADTSFRELVTLNNRDWVDYDGTLVNLNDRAPVFYDFTVTNAAMHRIGLQLINHNADMTDDYKFRVQISVNGHVIGVTTVFADLDLSGHGYINTPWLNAGTHRIGLTWLNNASGAGGRRGTDFGIEKVQLYALDAPDSDHDGVQDWEEAAIAATTATDTDGDGLSDHDEVALYGTSPVLADTDGDGLKDNEEVLAGTDGTNPDSDGDGITDGEEVHEALTNPLTADFDGTVTDVDFVNGCETNAAAGDWVVSGTEIVAKRRRGFVEYTLTAPVADIYRILVDATHDWLKETCSPVPPIDSSELMFFVDGHYLGKKTLKAPDGVFGDARAFTPYLHPGNHTVRIFWENIHSKVSLRIKDLRLQSLGGPDSDQDGMKDWVEASIASTTGLDTEQFGHAPGGVYTSAVSPVCLEGKARFVDMMNLAVGTNAVPVHQGAGERWYADLDLSASGPTAFDLSFFDDAVHVVTNVTWTALDLFHAGDLTLRKDDALMLNVAPVGASNGNVSIAISLGATAIANLSTTLAQPVTYRFDAPGLYTVTGQFSNQSLTTNHSITVDVVAGSFPTNVPACLLGKTRTWPCTNMPDRVVMEHDDTVKLTFTNNTMTLSTWKVNGEHYAVARVSEGGAILDGTPIHPFWAQGAADGYMWIVEQYADSALWENRLVFKNVPDDVNILLRSYSGGVIFDDLSLERWLTNRDLDPNGEYTLGLIIPSGVDPNACHEVMLYQNGVFLGQAYYAGVLMPPE